MTTANFPFAEELLGQVPESAFFSFQDQFGPFGSNQRQFFNNAFTQIHNEFLGLLGQQLRRGEAPTDSFTEFLDQPNFFENRFRQLSPFQRGEQPTRFAPRNRSIFF